MARGIASAIVLALAATLSLGAQAKASYTLSLIHINDTHSKFEPSMTKLTLDIDESLKAKPVYLGLGGFFQGTHKFIRYGGEADVAMWNLIKPDIAVLGNHEFDKGPQSQKDVFLSKIAFPVVDANVDMREEPALKGAAPAAYKVLSIGGQKIGVIGATTTETPFISSPGKYVAPTAPSPARAGNGAATG
jgi:5'-nucleotidase / UDP-sugar diphosphatase